VIDTVAATLTDAGYEIRNQRFALARSDARMFATFDLGTSLAQGVALAIGVRNSFDKSFPLGFAAGSRVFVCSNLAFRSELIVSRKHTVNGAIRFVEAISLAVQSLSSFQEQETARIEAMQQRALTDESAESLILRAFESHIVSHRLLPGVIGEWRKPSFPEFEERTAWSLYNAFTHVLGPRAKSNPQQHAALTIRLGGLFGGDGAALGSPGNPIALEPPGESAN
jgi:hypothetical protein